VILTVTPNAAVDKTYRVERFELDRVNRPSASFTVAGGKGINVARVYQTLGGKAVATGFLGGINGSIVSAALAAEQIESGFVQVEGESRVCIAIIDPTTGTQTEVNESGPTVSPINTHDLIDTVERLISERAFDYLVLCGSLPPGVSSSLYADLISRTKPTGIKTVLDTSGEPLALGVAAKPWMVKPNQAEMESLVGGSVAGMEALRSAISDLHLAGVEVVVATRGAQGAVASGMNQVWEAVPPEIEFASAVASGDSFAAAFLWQLRKNETVSERSIESALRLATGAGAANAAVVGAGFCTRQAIRQAAQGTQLRRLA